MKQLSTLVFLLMSFTMTSTAWAAHFPNPKWQGFALDWCANFEVGCGQPAAEEWCQKKGYSGAQGFQIQPHVNYETMTVNQNAICNPQVHGCDSFAYIDCKETVKTFNKPTINGYRVDWCDQFENSCGQPAALAFCQKAGFTQLVNFGFDPQLAVQTMTVGSHAICNPAYHRCDGFTYIECKK